MKNLRPIGIPALHHSRESLRPDLRRQQARRRYRARPRRLPRAWLLQGHPKRSPGEGPRCRGPEPLYPAPIHRQARRYSHPHRRGRALQARRHQLHRQQSRPATPRSLRAQFAQKDGEYFNATLFGKGIEQLRKAYGELGYINFVGTPVPRTDEAKKLIYLDIDIDEGKPFYVSRIEFTGNSITRDKVIRRELLLEEGQIYNSRLWDLSILRLNQLNYFEALKADQDSESRQNADEGTVDLLLKLKEKGKNSIGLNGGISGLSGTFIGLNYETNNFLGLGETLSVQANIGDLSRAT